MKLSVVQRIRRILGYSLIPLEHPNIHILIRCGIGDAYTYLSRLNSLLQKYPGSKIYFYIGGHKKIPHLIADLFQTDTRIYGSIVLEGYEQSSKRRMKIIEHFVKKRLLPHDIFQNWIPDTFPLRYAMQIPFSPTVFSEDSEYVKQFFERNEIDPSYTIGIQPISTIGNANSMEEQRFWPMHNWHALISGLLQQGYKIIIFGASAEHYGIKIDNKKIFSFLGNPIRQTIAALSILKGFIGTNSWCWEVTAYMKKPTYCFFFVNTHYIPLHIPAEPLSEVIIQTNRAVDVESVLNQFIKLLKGNL